MKDRYRRSLAPFTWSLVLFLAGCQAVPRSGGESDGIRDVVIYGGTSAGVIAAVEVASQGRSVLLVEPGEHLGGLSSGGLGQTDIGNKAAIGGRARDFYARIAGYYRQDEAWKFQERAEYRSIGQSRTEAGEVTMWTFEPHVAERIFEDLVAEFGVEVWRSERLDRSRPLVLRDGRIEALPLESGKRVRGKIFIDATYEGDLLALAGVSYHVGREAISEYDESLNGVQVRRSVHHQLYPGVDPHRVAGDPTSGLLPGIDPDGPGEEGTGDARVQAYCFRMCLTDHPDNRAPFTQPEGFDPLEYELLLRNFEAGETKAPWHHGLMPNRKTDTNNNTGVSTDYIGHNYSWPEASHAEREEIYRRHLIYQQGLMWVLANHPRVPAAVREEVSRWGTSRDEFVDNGGWSHQLYVREGRRMISDYVMTQHDCQGRRVPEDPVGLAAYTMDSHNVQRYVDENGHARNEGDVQVGGFPPYPIAYRSIVPARDECENLLVPVSLSASHIAFGSIRMEPVFMVLGHSAAVAAGMSLETGKAVQDIEYAELRRRLLAAGQVLEWTGPRPVTGHDPARFEGLVLDDDAAEVSGGWVRSTSVPRFLGTAYRHDNAEGKGLKRIRFEGRLEEAGDYELRMAYTPHANRAPAVPVRVEAPGVEKTFRVDQRVPPALGPEGAKIFSSLGVVRITGAGPLAITVETAGTEGYVIVDAFQVLRIPDPAEDS